MATAKILVVDDEIIIARELEARLTALGYQVSEIASSGREALELAERDRPDLVLMDIVLKGNMDGVEAAAEIRARWGTPVIYLTAYADEAILQRAQVTEPFGYIVKPFSERELRANIEMAIYKHRAESHLRSMEKWFASSMQQIGDGVIATDSRGNISFMNRKAGLLTGCKDEEASGQKLEDVVLVYSGNRTSRLDPMTLITVERGVVVDVEGKVFVVNRSSNEEIPVYLVVSPVEVTSGECGVMVILRDISERKRSQELLREIEERYLQTQKLEAVGLLAGGIAHEFNNLLTVISGYTSLLLSNLQVRQVAEDQLKGIQQAGQRATHLTSRLLSFSRRRVIEDKVVDLNHLVTSMAAMLRQLIGEDITLTTSLAPDLARVRIDPGQLEQSLMNLVVNARDAMPGGGYLTIETAKVGLEESLLLGHLGIPPGRCLKLTVKDTGCGMSPAVRERIFEPFFTTKEPGSGTGLGLATVYGTVQRSRGHIIVNSEPGIGSTFSIFLPTVEAAADPPEIEPPPIKARPTRETVLLVEDDDLVRACILQFLRPQGYQVLESRSPQEGLTICQEYKGSIHLLVTDVVMPGMSGGQLAERARQVRQAMKVLYISGYPGEIVTHRGVLEAGATFLQKPFAPDTLARKVREVLDRSE